MTGVGAVVGQDLGVLVLHRLVHGGSARQEPGVLDARAEQVRAGVNESGRAVVGADHVVRALEALVEEQGERGGVRRVLGDGRAGDGVERAVSPAASVLQTHGAVRLGRVVGLRARGADLRDERVALNLVPLAGVLKHGPGCESLAIDPSIIECCST